MASLPLLVALLGAAATAAPTRSLRAWIGSDPVRLRVVRTEPDPGGLQVRDSIVLVEADSERPGAWRGEVDTLVGPVRLVGSGRKGWRVPEGTVVRRAPLVWGFPVPPPLQVSGDSLCHWGPVVARLSLQDRPATWDSVCFDHSGQVRSARLLSKWEEWHPWISMRVERDPGHRMRGPVFVDPPDRMVLEPDPSFAREPGDTTGFRHDFRWLDDSGVPLRDRRILSWTSLDGMPCLRARAGRLDAGVRPRFSSLYRPVCWLALPGSGDTLTEFENGTSEVEHSGWKTDVAGIAPRDGWTAESAIMRLRNQMGSAGLQYEIVPESYRWRRGDTRWAPVLPDPAGPWLVPAVAPATIPPLQDPDVVWKVEPANPSEDSLSIRGFGTAVRTGRYRWRTPDSLVARAMLHLSAKARAILKQDSVEIEVAARLDSIGISIDRSGAFRTVAHQGMFLGGGAVLGWGPVFSFGRRDDCPTFVLEHDSTGNRVLALAPPAGGRTGLRFIEKDVVRAVSDGRLDANFRPRLGEPVVLSTGPKQQPRVRSYPPRP